MDRDSQRGFSLIELLITVAILAVVTAIAIVALLSALDRARQRATMGDMRSIATAIESYTIDHNWPPPTSTSTELIRRLTPYHSSVLALTDHWNTPYSYVSAVGVGDYTLESFGKDGTDGANITLGTRFDFDLDIVFSNGKFIASPE